MNARPATLIRAELVWVGLACSGLALAGWGLGGSEPKPFLDPTTKAEAVSFGEDIRPILVRNCLVCHGFDPSTREADLRLDTFEEATKPRGRRGGRAISPGEPGSSMLLDRVSSGDPDFRMPPEGEPLSQGEIALLEDWIERGARYERHWSLKPVRAVEPPQAKDPEWNRGPIDRFVFSGISQAGLTPGNVADRRVLIRRLSFDLTGLPPSPERVDEFVNDPSPDAVERLVDELLDSPRFGERWARHWLDLMRYAETYAHEFDYTIVNAWGYRDYVIRALNADVPYDDFVTEHLAGDLMPEPRRDRIEGTNESILGTGFWWLSQGTHAPVDVRSDEAERIDNQIDVFTKSVLATTVSCARCHDHKFDPILQSEYYGLSGFLQSSRRQQAYLDPGGEIANGSKQMAALSAELAAAMGPRSAVEVDPSMPTLLRGVSEVLGSYAEADEEGDSPEPRLRIRDRGASEVAAEVGVDPEALERWVSAFEPVDPASTTHPMSRWLHAEAGTAIEAKPSSGAAEPVDATTLFESFDGSGFVDRWTLSGWAMTDATTHPGDWRAPGEGNELAEARALDSGNVSATLMGTARSATFEIKEPYIWVRARGRKCMVRVIVDGYTMDEYNALLFGSAMIKVDTDRWEWRRHDMRKYMGHRAHYEIIDDSADGSIAVDRIVFSDSPDPPSLPAAGGTVTFASLDEASDAVHDAVLATLSDEATPEGYRVTNWLLERGLLPVGSARVSDLRADFRQLSDTLPEPRRGLAMEDGTGEDERLFVRGNPHEFGDVAPRGFLGALSRQPQMDIPEGSGRLLLAEAVFDETNPMPARVMVNRVWHHLLGRGIVPTTDDFGLLGESPSHPELLDYLASRFAGDLGWSVKSLIREIVLSRAYRGASEPMGEPTRAVDPENRLLSVRTPKRLDGESIRDAILTASGGLDHTMFGPSVPVYLTEFMSGRGKPGRSGPIDGNGRRSVYLEVRRNFLNPMMQAFDAPVPHSTRGMRSKSNVPAQSLILMNSPLVVQQAGVLAARLSGESSDDRSRIDQMYWLALGRGPSASEIDASVGFLRTQTEAFEQEGHSAPQHAALIDLCHVVFNLKEFSFVE